VEGIASPKEFRHGNPGNKQHYEGGGSLVGLRQERTFLPPNFLWATNVIKSDWPPKRGNVTPPPPGKAIV